MIHVTNGDAAVASIAATGIPGTIVPWRDVLHEGPVPAGLTEPELREVRARFLAAQGWGSYVEILDGLDRRDGAVACACDHDEVVLWFEDDLYDQLQLLQGVDSLGRVAFRGPRITLVSVTGALGSPSATPLPEAFADRVELTPAHLALASRAWGAFRSPDPTAIEDVIGTASQELFPFLHDALVRLLEEYPSSWNGLSRTEAQALQTLASGGASLREAYFMAHHELEERVFLGDTVFALVVARMAQGAHPLVASADGRPAGSPTDPAEADWFWSRQLDVTEAGRLVLEGRQDAAKLNGLNRWVGGVHLHGHDPAWRWDSDARRLRAAGAGEAS